MYGKEFSDGSMILGSPAKVVKQLSPEHRAHCRSLCWKCHALSGWLKKDRL